jgi:hypothetical protein
MSFFVGLCNRSTPGWNLEIQKFPVRTLRESDFGRFAFSEFGLDDIQEDAVTPLVQDLFLILAQVNILCYKK